jgi:hypothetical protein
MKVDNLMQKNLTIMFKNLTSTSKTIDYKQILKRLVLEALITIKIKLLINLINFKELNLINSYYKIIKLYIKSKFLSMIIKPKMNIDFQIYL